MVSGMCTIVGWAKEKPTLQLQLKTAAMPWYEVMVAAHLPSYPGTALLRFLGSVIFVFWMTLAFIPDMVNGLQDDQLWHGAPETGYFQAFCIVRAIRGEMIMVR